jgi:hypothetical protein
MNVDFMEVEIKVGDLIVYPVRRRTIMKLKRATVTELAGNETLKPGIRCVNENGRTIIITMTTRCVIVKRFGE